MKTAFSALLLLGLAAPLAMAQANPSPIGYWVPPQHKAVIQIYDCGSQVCGEIVGMVMEHADDPMPKNWQGGPQCHTVILQTTPSKDGDGNQQWVGKVLDPRDGGNYQAQLKLDSDGNLVLHGYLGLPIFGQTQTWTRYTGPVPADCRLGPSF